jgi:Uma2 family endonuclease
MNTTTFSTAADLLALPTGLGKRYELVTGEIREMSPSGWRHGQVVSTLHTLLDSYIRAHQLGRSFGAETGFLIERNPDTVRAPDFAFIARENLPLEMPTEAFWPGAPDLAVEVLSPSDKMGEVDEKIEAWLTAGCAAVWVIDSKLQTVTVYRSRTDVEIKTVGETLDGGQIVPGFSCPVVELFR